MEILQGHKRLASHVIYCLLDKISLMSSLHKIPKLGKSFGQNLHSTTHSTTSCLTLTISLPEKATSSSPISNREYRPGITVLEIRSEFNLYRRHSRPSTRPKNWLENKFSFNKRRENKLFPSRESYTVFDARTLRLCLKSHYQWKQKRQPSSLHPSHQKKAPHSGGSHYH